MEEVNLYIEPPPGVTADRVDCKITPNHIRLGIKGNPPFLDVSALGSVFAVVMPLVTLESEGGGGVVTHRVSFPGRQSERGKDTGKKRFSKARSELFSRCLLYFVRCM